MEINLKDSRYIDKGTQLYNHEVMNVLLQKSSDCKQSLYEKNQMYLSLDQYIYKRKTVFFIYKDAHAEFTKNKSIGAYYRWFIKYYPLNEQANNEKAYNVHGPLIWTNNKYDKKSLKCWGYDINSAYPAALLQPIPDVNNPLGPGIIGENQVGFVLDKEGFLEEKKMGVAMWRFNLIESPWKEKYVPDKYSDLLFYKKIGDIEKAKKIKEEFVCSIGCLRNHNAFLYSHILTVCRENLQKYVNEDTILINTDCIYSATPRPDIPIGTEIGLFKELEQNGTEIYVDGANYVWENGERRLRGVPKELQATYDLKTKTQIRKPDFYVEGNVIYDGKRV